MNIANEIERAVSESGFTEFGFIVTDKLKYYDEVRGICEANTCRNYASSWACPPAVGTVSECRERVNKYEKMILFSRVYKLEDSFDFEGMIEGLRDFKQLADSLQSRLDELHADYLLLSNEGCGRCTVCTYPDSPCRFPHKLHHSLEGYGFMVNELAKEVGIKYNNGPGTVTYFGALVF